MLSSNLTFSAWNWNLHCSTLGYQNMTDVTHVDGNVVHFPPTFPPAGVHTQHYKFTIHSSKAQHNDYERQSKRRKKIKMASSDEPAGGLRESGLEPQPAGQKIGVAQQMLDKGASILQSLKPVKQISHHACTFALYAHDLSRQIETHHYVSRLNQDFLQCAVYDSDASHAHLIGTLPSILLF